MEAKLDKKAITLILGDTQTEGGGEVKKEHFDKIALGLKNEVWDRNHRLRAATVVAGVAQELNPNFNSFDFFEACGLVDRRAA